MSNPRGFHDGPPPPFPTELSERSPVSEPSSYARFIPSDSQKHLAPREQTEPRLLAALPWVWRALIAAGECIFFDLAKLG